ALALLKILKELVREDWLEEKFSSLDAECKRRIRDSANGPVCWMPVDMFKVDEVKVAFNESALEIRILVPPNLRSTRTSSLYHVSSDLADEITNRPSWLSSYINFNASDVFRSAESSYRDGRDPATVAMDSGTRMGRLVVDANANYVES